MNSTYWLTSLNGGVGGGGGLLIEKGVRIEGGLGKITITKEPLFIISESS